MTSLQIANLAHTMVHYSTRVGAGENVGIISSPEAAPLIRELVREVLRAGGYPYVLMGLERLLGLDGLDQILFEEANDEQLAHVLRTERMVREEFEVMLTVRAQSNTRNLANADPDRYQRWVQARTSMMDTFLRRSATGAPIRTKAMHAAAIANFFWISISNRAACWSTDTRWASSPASCSRSCRPARSAT